MGMVMDFISKGEKLMEDPNCPKFLEGHVKKLKEAWDDTNEKAQSRKKALVDNMNSWETFEEKKVECHKQLDAADAEFEAIKKKSITLVSIVFNLSFCLNLVAEKNLPYKGSPSAGIKPYLVQVEDTEDNNGESGTYMLRTKSDLSVGGDVIGGSIHNGKGAKVDIDADNSTVGRTVRSSKCSRSKCRKCKECWFNCVKGRWTRCRKKYNSRCEYRLDGSKINKNCKSKCKKK